MSGIPAWVRLGVKAVYVGKQGLPNQPGSEHLRDPVVGEIYTINWKGWLGDQFCIGFAELDQDSAFDPRCFRPLVSIEDDLKAHFQALLHVRNPQLEAAE